MAVVPAAPLQADERASEREQRLIEIFAAHADLVFATCYGILHDRDEAADASQETFIRALRSLESIPDDARPWLRVVARNYCYDVLRSRRRQATLAAGLARAMPASTNPEAQALDRLTLNRALRGLKPRDREALWSALVEERPMPEVARRLGLTYMGAAQVVHRARQRAMKLLRDVGTGLAPLLRLNLGTSGAGRAAAVIAGLLLPALVVIGAGSVPDGSGAAGSPTIVRPAPPARPAAADAATVPGIGSDRASERHGGGSVGAGLPRVPDVPAAPDLPGVPDLPNLPDVSGTAGGLTDGVTGTVGSITSSLPGLPAVPDVGGVAPPVIPVPSPPIQLPPPPPPPRLPPLP